SPIKLLTDLIASAHEPDASPREALCLILPSFPTTRPKRASSCVRRSLSRITSLKVSATLPAMPVQSSGSLAEKSPRLNAVKAARNCLLSSWSPLIEELLSDRRRGAEAVFFIGYQATG